MHPIKKEGTNGRVLLVLASLYALACLWRGIMNVMISGDIVYLFMDALHILLVALIYMGGWLWRIPFYVLSFFELRSLLLDVEWYVEGITNGGISASRGINIALIAIVLPTLLLFDIAAIWPQLLRKGRFGLKIQPHYTTLSLMTGILQVVVTFCGYLMIVGDGSVYSAFHFRSREMLAGVLITALLWIFILSGKETARILYMIQTLVVILFVCSCIYRTETGSPYVETNIRIYVIAGCCALGYLVAGAIMRREFPKISGAKKEQTSENAE